MVKDTIIEEKTAFLMIRSEDLCRHFNNEL